MEGEWNKNEGLVAIISCVSPFPVVKERKEARERERENSGVLPESLDVYRSK